MRSPADVATMRATFADFEEFIRKREFRNLVRMDQVFTARSSRPLGTG